jgi:hypothetical protein
MIKKGETRGSGIEKKNTSETGEEIGKREVAQ